MSTDRVIFSVDYELFFGLETGSVQNCLIDPTNALVEILDSRGVKLSLFVDAGFLVRLAESTGKFKQLGQDWSKVKHQLTKLAERGHDIQLHVHPHWEDSYFDGSKWRLDTRRYKLHDFADAEKSRIVEKYKKALLEVSDGPIIAYRAGGWCIQPFKDIREALMSHGIWLDSTVFRNGKSEDEKKGFSFVDAPGEPVWRFSTDPLVADEGGEFVEIPISSFPLKPHFYWEMAIRKKISGELHQPFGNGSAIKSNASYYLTRLLNTVTSPVSIDGIKARMLPAAFEYHRRHHRGGIFNVMGHPKSLTRYSIGQVANFLDLQRGNTRSIVFQDLAYLNPIKGSG